MKPLFLGLTRSDTVDIHWLLLVVNHVEPWDTIYCEGIQRKYVTGKTHYTTNFGSRDCYNMSNMIDSF